MLFGDFRLSLDSDKETRTENDSDDEALKERGLDDPMGDGLHESRVENVVGLCKPDSSAH